ncbi:hypothetical protein [uncultured Tenacibaculum sp.]|uniref:hypothetical protein n=1 Tax=uncultured Tenacibaculum sp. TaxID=174713 RepID=UPI00261D7AA9|nr:hypothetical protein [uncultured Tenacibaculum sp.]
MKTISIIAVLCLSFVIAQPKTKEVTKNLNSCEFEGKKLYGKIKLVEYASQADVKVKIVNNFPDLKVKFVENFADECGEWQIVENNEDLKVYITESFPDIKIQPVTSFPGLVK